MAKVKLFTSQKRRIRPLSLKSDTKPVREVNNSRVGFDAQRHRIKTKYRTRLARKSQKIKSAVEWDSLSEVEQAARLGDVRNSLANEEEEELKEAKKLWQEFISTGYEEASDASEFHDDESYEEWNGIGEDKKEREQEKQEEGQEPGRDESPYDSNEDDTEDPGFEDGDADVDDDEELKDEEGLTSGLKEIIERHMQGLKQKIEVFRRLADLEKEEEEEEENSS